MTAHELARRLLSLPDIPVWIYVDADEGTSESEISNEIQVRRRQKNYTDEKAKDMPECVFLT